MSSALAAGPNTRPIEVVDLHVTGQRLTRAQVTHLLMVDGKRWVAGAVVVIIAAVAAGFYAATLVPVRYTGEADLVVGSNSLTSLSVPGYVQASETLASNYARYVPTGDDELTSLERTLDASTGSLYSIKASPVVGSNLLRIQVVARTPGTARTAAAALAQSLVKQVGAAGVGVAALRAQLSASADAVATAQQSLDDATQQLKVASATFSRKHPRATVATGPSIDAAKRRLKQARAALLVDDVEQQNASQVYISSLGHASDLALRPVGQASLVRDSKSQVRQWGAAGGLLVGLLLAAAVLALGVSRTRARRGR